VTPTSLSLTGIISCFLFLGHLRSANLDVAGASLLGSAPILIGSNRNIGWSFTAAGPDNHDWFMFQLNPQNQEEYLPRHGTGYAPFPVEEFTIEIKGGERIRFQRRLSDHGILVHRSPSNRGLALKIAHQGAFSMTRLLLEFNRSRSMEEFRRALAGGAEGPNGIQPLNVLAADSRGELFYVDYASVPQRRDPELDYGGIVDGNDPRTEWLRDAHPLEDLPQTSSRSVLINCNVSPRQTDPSIPPRPAYMTGSRETLTTYRQMLIEDQINGRRRGPQPLTRGAMEEISVHSKNLYLLKVVRVLDETRRRHSDALLPELGESGARMLDAWLRRLIAWDGLSPKTAVEPALLGPFLENLQRLPPNQKDRDIQLLLSGGRPNGLRWIESLPSALLTMGVMQSSIVQYGRVWGYDKGLGDILWLLAPPDRRFSVGGPAAPQRFYDPVLNQPDGLVIGGQSFVYVSDFGDGTIRFLRAVGQDPFSGGKHAWDLPDLWSRQEFSSLYFADGELDGHVESVERLPYVPPGSPVGDDP